MSRAGEQLTLFSNIESKSKPSDRSSTFVDNMKLPVHRWFRYSAGFSADWVKGVIAECKTRQTVTLFDPFAGSGTALIAGEASGIQAYGTEAHPFVIRVAAAKLLWREGTADFSRFAEAMIKYAKQESRLMLSYPSLIQKCFPSEILQDLDALKRGWLAINDGSAAALLSWLALTSILRACSPVGTSQMELIQPRKHKQNSAQPFAAFAAQVQLMLNDIRFSQRMVAGPNAIVYEADARSCEAIENQTINLVITSPPYVNNFDYADATRFEMSFWGEVSGWGDLQEKVRKYLVRSCTQHMSPQDDTLEQLLNEELALPISRELREACKRLEEERLEHGGKKNYHLMVAAYFSDMAKVWRSLRRVCSVGSRVCFVIGDSAPYGIYLPVHQWLGEIAIAAGFKHFLFEKTRDRNIKWKNRKHRVPLCEGRLWVEG